MRFESYLYTDTGGRKENEDSLNARRYGENVVCVVADGLGGQGDGKAASSLVCDSLMACGADGVFPTEEDVAAAFARANAQLLAAQRNAYHMKTTAVYLCVRPSEAIWAHIGDSRLYHVHNGRLEHFTLDHSASQMAVFLGAIRREDIPSDPGRSRLVRAMGVEGDAPEIHPPVALENVGRHVFLLCSDGFWEYCSDGEVAEAAELASGAEDLVRRLWELKHSRSGADCDNSSAAVIFMDWR